MCIRDSRKIIDVTGTRLDDRIDGLDLPLGEALLEPTRIYHHGTRAAHTAGHVTGICHVTGGGLVENPPRVFGEDLSLAIDCTSWKLPSIFSWLSRKGGIEAGEMARTFNCGIGLLIFTSEDSAGSCLSALRDGPEPDAWIAGRLSARGGGPAVVFSGQESWSTAS